jgi:hypothetical protein
MQQLFNHVYILLSYKQIGDNRYEPFEFRMPKGKY